MKDKLYGNKDIRGILGIPERRVINLTDKSVILPFVDSAGAGSQRRYNYANLLEFAISEVLFGFGLGIHLVKKILNELHQGGHLIDWAENWDGYYREVAQKEIEWLKNQHNNPNFSSMIISDGKLLDLSTLTLEQIKERLKPEQPCGLLVCRFKEDKSLILKTIPWDRQNFLATIFLGEYAYNDVGVLTINLGEIKKNVDKRIEVYRG